MTRLLAAERVSIYDLQLGDLIESSKSTLLMIAEDLSLSDVGYKTWRCHAFFRDCFISSTFRISSGREARWTLVARRE